MFPNTVLERAVRCFRPSFDIAQGNGNDINHVNGKPEDFLRPFVIFWVKELEFDIPTIAIYPTEGTFIYFNAIQFHPCGNRFPKGGSRLKGIGGGIVKGAIASYLS